MCAAAAPVLEVHGLRKAYGSLVALDGVDLVLRAGELCALLGPNGAGKTTLIQLLTGLFGADGGSVRIAGHDVRRQPTRALAQLGVVFQQPTLDLDLTVRGNLRYHAALHGLGRRAAGRIDAALAAFDLAGSAAAPCRTLSGGNRRRVELARALLHAPRLLLLDEPTVGLDPAARRGLMREVRARCAAQGVAVLWATHLVDEAAQADRAIVLHRGRVLADAAPGQLSDAHGGDLERAFLALTGAAAAA